MITVGIATRMPSASVTPMSAPIASMATSGPGCGGTRPWSTDRPATAGMPMAISDTWLRHATSSTIGSRSTTPTSKNSGNPSSAATPAIAHGSTRTGTRSTTVFTTLSAPLVSASSAPIIAPRAIRRPTLPVVLPTPSVKLSTVLAGPRPAMTPSTADPRIRARNGCMRSIVISRTTVAIPRTAAVMSWASPAVVAVSLARAAIMARSPGR
jgi:hypothetical protein